MTAAMYPAELDVAKRDVNVFEGTDSIYEFLNPDHFLPSPLVELLDHLNAFRASGVRIFAKLAYLSPLLNIKSFPA